MPADILAQVENPSVRIFDFPSFGQHAGIVALVEIIGAETAHGLAPDAIEHRDAVAVGIESLHGFGDTDSDTSLSLKPSWGSDSEERNQYRGRKTAVHSSRPHRILL